MKSLYPNRQFAEEDPLFRTACRIAGIQPTKRQASKWRRGEGKAYEYLHQAREELRKQNA